MGSTNRARRSFLGRLSMGAAGLLAADRAGVLLGGFSSGRVRAAGEKVVVAVSLFGGNDVLNTLVPVGDYDRYRSLRPTLAWDRERLLPLAGTPDFALNPGLQPLADLYAQGRVAFVPGAGAPLDARDLFDHAAQQASFQSCDFAGTSQQPTGWLGRYCDAFASPGDVTAIDLGGGRLMVTGAVAEPLSIQSIDALSLALSFDAEVLGPAYLAVQSHPSANAVGERHRSLRRQAVEQSGRIQQAVAGYVPGAAYPAGNTLASQLRECARILWGGIGVRALCVGLGGFDTHGSQEFGRSESALGFHASLLSQVGAAIAAFQADLEAHGLADDVLTLVLSEFGRTAHENGSIGSDHGLGGLVVAVGTSVQGGVHGNYPGLAADRLVMGGVLDVTTDLRSVYATTVANFLDADPVPVMGGAFPLLSFV